MKLKTNPALQFIKEIKETSDLAQVSSLLASGEWIAICAAGSADGTYLFALGRVV